MANKTYFKGKKKSTVKSKKYQFAGFDEATQINNTGYLNALYNPMYYDPTTVNNEDIKQNVLADVATGQKLAMDKKVMQTTTDANLKRLQGIKNEAEAKDKQQFSEATEQNKDQAIISGSADLLTKGVDIAKQYMKPIAPAVTNTINVGGNILPKTLTLPGGKFGVGKTIDFSKLGQVTSSKAGAEVGKQGFTSALGSTTWATPGAAATAGGVGAVLSIGGKLWDTLSEDDNPYEYTKKEKWGDWGGNLLSEIGTYGGLGSMFGPIGTGIGAVVGAGIGTFKAIRESKKNKKQAADLNAKKAEEDRLYQEQLTNYNNALASQQRFYDYSKNQLRNSILTGEERMRQNRLMGLTEGQLAGNTNIAMTGGGRKYFGKGGVNVPGGQVVPIGQGAVEFVGRSHAQGGIRLDAKTEVEGGETMDKVRMKNGKMNDYFFSKFLKYKGKSFAQHHKELIKRGASQEEIQALAKKQEAMANRKGEKDRSPKQVAEYGGFKKYFTGGVKKYKTAGAVGDPIDPLIMTAIVRLGINDTNLSNYKKEKTNDGVKIKHIKTGKEIFFNSNEIKDLTSSKNTYGPGETILRGATEEEMKQMQSDSNPSFFDYAKGVYNVITNPLDAIQYTNTRGNIMDDPANWLRMVEMDQQNNPNPVNELLELAPSVMSMGAAGPKYTVTMTPKAPNFGLGTGSAIPKSSLSRAYDLARPTFTRSPIMVPRVTAKQPAGTTVTTGAQRIATRNSGSTAVGNRFYDNRYYGRRDFWEQNLPPEVTVSGTASRKINIPSYTIKPPLAGFAGGYMGPFGEDFINYTTNPEYIGQYGTILNTGNNRNTGNTGSTDNTEEYYKTDEERKAAEKIRQKVADYWASGYSGSTGRGGTGTSAGYTQSTTSAAPPFTGSLALGTGNSNSTKVQNAKTDDKKDDKKDLNMPQGKKEAIPFNRDLANRLALLQIGAGLPSIIPPLIALGKDIPTPNWDPFTYNRIPSVGGAPAITAGSVAAPRLSRVDYSDKMTKADEMALAAMNKSAEAGPQSGILNMAILGKNYRQILELQKQETDENKKQSDIEKQLAAKVSEGNRDAAMSAASKNAENILKTNDINSAINQANLGAELKRYEYISQKNDLEYRKNIEKYLTDLSALETLAGIPMQIASDTAKTYSDQYLAYLASDPTSGVYDRYINAMLGREDKKKTGGIKKYTSRLGDLVKNPKLKSKII